MAKINVARAEVCELLGVDAGVDDSTLQRALDEALARQKARAEVSAAEQRARAEDCSIVLAAYNEGKIPGSRIEFWCAALQNDRASNRAVLASLASGLVPNEQVAVDPDVEKVHAKVMSQLGFAQRQPSGQVAAAAPVSSPPTSSGVMRDSVGLPIPGIPAPVRLVRGKPPEEWTKQERDDAALWALGPAFRRGLRPPPGSSGYYYPSPNDVSTYDEASGEWRPKTDYQARGD